MKSSVYFIAACIAVERESEDGEIDLGREIRVSPTRLFRFISTRQVARKDEQKSTLVKVENKAWKVDFLELVVVTVLVVEVVKWSGAFTGIGVEHSRVTESCCFIVLSQGVPDPSSDVRDPRAALARDLFLVRDSIRQLASDDQGVPDQVTKDDRDPTEATRSIPACVLFVSSSRLNSFGGPIQQSSKVKR
ncbi:hypothetical protein F2Q69_00050058 [Brassica cretica]|uniref:Uncharacterized protein n=1 Tax=Brassica cretica TaxID=69181 RepID=A0A8S9PT83_BRACR|nr:hypothetical protein F2Q69_00050058 [Brassica cretica]